MAHVVTEKCRDCRFTDCVDVCPVDCFYVWENQLIINPDECIDCTACVELCPVEAIYAEEDLPEGFSSDLEFNAEKASELEEQGAEPIAEQQEPLPTAAEKKSALGY